MISVIILAILLALALWGSTSAFLEADAKTKLLILRVSFTAVLALIVSSTILFGISQL